MSITVKGVIDRKGFGAGTWAIDSEQGETYEIHNPPSELQKKGLKVKIEGKIRDDIMTLAMIGPVLEVKKFEIAK
ncbi:hypothetical protein C7B65_11340 [Phormidesmis priestleyi ULC007]|uniref:Uncharacterized protein n=1 Tax=Phormidesmis priestleyi ULC007 TaxID=1920490 RepID=A0A2T1DGD4_9CYAN|nr:hypothetical protein [Phormidesmis priestleyi]PSB19504.1 hypothetical protein C7B65_11340 [Phormidesmis priestleyi ULC007]PZO53056.1 MAG: hypothetical protein DCF14_05415 [Phormidesmis priestleyi]